MADFTMCRLTTCEFAQNCRRHWRSGTEEKAYGQDVITHHPAHKGHTYKKPCLAYLPIDPKFKQQKTKPKKADKDDLA